MIDAVEPCAALSDDQLARLHVVPWESAEPDLEGRRQCYWLHSPDEPRESYAVELITKYGAEALLRNSLGADVVRIAGFPAVEVQTLYAPRETSCQIFLDVAGGQTVQVSYSYNGNLPMNRKMACEKNRVAAEFVMQTLLTHAGG